MGEKVLDTRDHARSANGGHGIERMVASRDLGVHHRLP
jgi:hypothetical protein